MYDGNGDCEGCDDGGDSDGDRNVDCEGGGGGGGGDGGGWADDDYDDDDAVQVVRPWCLALCLIICFVLVYFMAFTSAVLPSRSHALPHSLSLQSPAALTPCTQARC